MKFGQVSALVAACAPAMVAAATAGVIPMPIKHTRGSNYLRKRSGTYTQTLTNNITYGGYYASVSVGTPAQSQDVVLDTGSSDTWFLASDASVCSSGSKGSSTSSGSSTSRGSSRKHRRQQQSTSACVSTYDVSSSSTFTNLSTTFDIEYVDGSGVQGYYFTDNLSVGGATIETLQMGLGSTSDDLNYGIMGVGFEADESADTLYPNVIEKFYTQGLIGSRAFSLYLDDLSASSGTILFGGLDKEKFSGELIAVPILKDSSVNNYTSFLVTLSSVASVNANGDMKTNFTTAAQAVVLDSGTTLTYLPEKMAQSIFSAFNATYDESLGYATVDCGIADDTDLALAFQFGGLEGPTVQIPLSELVLTSGSSGMPGMGQSATCAFGVSMSTSTFLLGDTFLRSAYVVYDLDAKEVAIAQSAFNSTKTNVVALASGSSIPEVSSTATSVVVASASGSGDSRHKSAAVSFSVAPLVTVAVGAIAGALLILA